MLAAAEPTRRSFGRRLLRGALQGVLVLVGAVVIAVLLRTFVGQMFVIPSGSMENTLQIDDRVLVAKFGGFARGDVVVFDDPGAWLQLSGSQVRSSAQQALEFAGILPNSEDRFLIKRVVGMPGDHVCTDVNGRVAVNGFPLDEAAYLYSQDGLPVAPSTIAFDVVVPKGRIFVLGDHRDNSNDSRYKLPFGTQDPTHSAFVPESSVEGAAVAILSPLDHLSTFTVPATFDHVPDAEAPAPDTGFIGPVGVGCS